MQPFEGKTLLLTGASMGIGRALAMELSRRKVNLVINARSGDLLHQTRELCANSGALVTCVAGDAAKSETVAAMLLEAEKIGHFTGFIHAAGVLHPGPYLWELEPHAFETVLQASLTAAYQLIRACMPRLLQQQQGLAVFFGSGAAEKAQPGIAAYCAAKAAEEHLARQLAAEAPTITTFVYRPGIVETRMQAQAREAHGGGAPHLHRVFRPWHEAGMLLTPAQAAAGLIQLLSADIRRWHGQTMDVRDL